MTNKSKSDTLQVLTANDLRDGEVVYLGARGWCSKLADAQVLDSKAGDDALLGVTECDVIGAYLIEVSVGADGPQPLKLRELHRAQVVQLDVAAEHLAGAA